MTATATVADYSNSLFNTGEQKIVFHHEWSGTNVDFKVFDISYSETITNDWEEVVLPRRINRSYTWSGVIRKISLGWSMPAFDIAEAKSNFAKCSQLVKMMYPMTDDDGVIVGGNPIWYLGIMNWVHAGGEAGRAGSDKNSMLAGFPDNFSYNIVPEDGFLYDGTGKSPYPKNIKVTMGYTVLLDDSQNFGWKQTEKADSEWQTNGPPSFPWSSDTAIINSTE
jgi:hypothetical protein